jgi:hypothetical protein
MNEDIIMKRKKIIFYILTTLVLIVSFLFELNGLILFFGIYSIFTYVGVLISFCKTYFGFVNNERTYYVYLFTIATLLFASLDIYVHYKNSLGLNNKIKNQLENIDSKLDILNYDLKKIQYNKSELVRAYGSVSKRNEREKELLDEQNEIFVKKDSLLLQKNELNNYSNFELDTSGFKFFIIFFVELLLLYCIKNKNNFTEDNVINKEEVVVAQEKDIPKQKRKYTKRDKIIDYSIGI